MNQLPKKQPMKLTFSDLSNTWLLIDEIRRYKNVTPGYAHSYLQHQLIEPAYAAMEDGRDKFEATVLGVKFSVR